MKLPRNGSPSTNGPPRGGPPTRRAKKLREDTGQDQGGYRCRPALGRIKIIPLGTAEAPSMSAAGRVGLYMLSIFIAASMMSSQTAMDVAGPGEQAQEEGDVSNPPPSAKSSPIIEPTVVTIVAHPVGRSVSFGQPLVPSSSEAIARELQKELKRVGC